MRKFLLWQRFKAYTAYTAVTFVATQWQHSLSKSGSTVAALNGTLHSLLSRLKTPFNSMVSGSSVGTSPNFAQELEIRDSWALGDEYDEEDFEEWYGEEADEWDWDYDNYGRISWEQRAVDEAIEEEPDDNPWDGLFGKNRFTPF